MEHTIHTTVLVHPDELSENWIRRAARNGIRTLGLHPVGGGNAASSLRDLLARLATPEYRGLLDRAADSGLHITYEMHSAGYLLDRGLFADHPEYFRMDETGRRSPDCNFCVSSAEGMALIAQNALSLAKSLYRSEHRYHFWLDDVRGKRCFCPECRALSASDQQLKALNSMLSAIRREIPDASLAYLAYLDTLEVPSQVAPDEGIFLEYAPYEKYTSAGTGNDEAILRERECLSSLKAFFPSPEACVLEYWLDNSFFSRYTKPPKPLYPQKAPILADIRAYLALGFWEITTFACYLGSDYEALYGEPDITPFTEACAEAALSVPAETRFRHAVPADLAKISGIYDAIHTGEESGRLTVGWQRGVYPTRQTAEDALARGDLYVCEAEGTVVGAAILNRTQMDCYALGHWTIPAEDGKVFVMHTLVIDPAYAGRGCGKAFTAYYERCASQLGCTVLRIDTQEKNLAARALYRQCGFTEADTIPCRFQGIDNVRLVLLEKKLF